MNTNFLNAHAASFGPRQFAAFRIALGAYLLVHFAQLLPFAAELFGSGGVLPDPNLNFVPALLPNPLWIEGAGHWLPALCLAVAMSASILIIAGRCRRPACVSAWLVWAWLFGRNNLINTPGLPYVGLLLLISALIPRGEAWCWRAKPDPQWEMPGMAPLAMWILLAAGYTFSGAMKLGSPSWIDGSAIRDVLENPLARPGVIRDLALATPDWMLRLATWGALALELLYLPLFLLQRARPVIWIAMVGMHLGIMLVVDFADLSLGMLLAHGFVFDRHWLAPRVPMVRAVRKNGTLRERSVRV